MVDIKKEIGNKIRAERKKSKLTQKQLAEVINTTQDHISEIENGNVNVSVEYLVKIAESLKVELKIVFA